MKEKEKNVNYEDVLEQRARLLAEKSKTADQRKVETLAAVVAVGQERFGLPVDGLHEILRTPPLCRLPATPPWFAGITQVRGDILSAVNLGSWFGGAESRGGFLAVTSGPQGLLGLLIDTVLNFREIFSDEIAERVNPALGQSISAITKDLVRLVDIRHLLSDERLIVDGVPHGSLLEHPDRR
jgi:twitching motility protein PilI